VRLVGQTRSTPYVTENANFIFDVKFSESQLLNPRKLAADLESIPGVEGVGLFIDIVTAAYFGYADKSVRKHTRLNTSIQARDVPADMQTKSLDTILSAVKAASAPGKLTPIVELDLDLTTCMPFGRTIEGLRSAGEAYGIMEFRNPLDYLSKLPGYSPEAWNSFLDAIPEITSKYPLLPWKASKDSKDAFLPSGAVGATVHSAFHIRFWSNADELEFDLPTPGLEQFEREVQQLGGKVVFISGRWKPEQVAATKRFLSRNLRHGRYELVIGNPNHDSGASDSQMKQLHQAAILQMGIPVAFIDDREKNLIAVGETLTQSNIPLIKVVSAIPGYSHAPFPGDGIILISDFLRVPTEGKAEEDVVARLAEIDQ
jgi:hypothetical protein